MAQKNLKYYYQKARKGGFALPQFNFSTAEQLQGIVQAAVRLKAPLLVGTSEGDSKFLGKAQAVALVESYRKETKLPIFLNFDHGKSFDSVKEAIEAGYDAVHFDGSSYSFKENIVLTRKVVALAKKNRVSMVEGEFAEIPGKHSVFHKGKAPSFNKDSFTDPKEAREFAQKTGVDSLAILIGTVHGVYKKNPRLNLKRLQEIKKRVMCFMVLHGGSGTPRRDLLHAVKSGVVKVNISTELRAAFTNTLRATLKGKPEEVTPYKILPPSVRAVQKVAEYHIQFLGSANKI
ncbi:class II fructose-bisphosphate aldolase [Patescibacteria group bacterium]|nr:class II fructose-bisphosphate aldolase [Patescibacteria group bacterium]